MREHRGYKIALIAAEIIVIIMVAVSCVTSLGNSYSVSLSAEDIRSGRAFSIPKGSYTMDIAYSAGKNSKLSMDAGIWYGTLLTAEDVWLSKNFHEVSCDFDVREDIPEEVVTLSISEGYADIDSVSIAANNLMLRRAVFWLVFLSAIIALCFINIEKITEKRELIAAGAIALFFSCLPLFVKGIEGHFGQDLEFHLLRIEGIATELLNGNFPARIESVWMDGYGYPSSCYYGDAMLYIPALLRIIGFPVVYAYKMYVVFINFLTLLISHLCFKRMIKKEHIAMLCAFAYTSASYRMIDIFIRAAVGEYTALTFLPIVMLGIYLIYSEDEEGSLLYKSSILALGMSAIVATHVMTTEMAAVAMVIFAVICYGRTFKADVIIPVVMAAVETVVLELYFIVPFIDCNLHQKVSVNYLAEGTRVIQKEGAYLSQYFSFFQNVYRVLDGKEFEGTQLTPGLPLMMALCVGLWLWFHKKAKRELRIMVALSVIMLVLSSNIFPWDAVAASSVLGNMLAQIQFPWRYLGMEVLFLSLLLGYIGKEYDDRRVFAIFAAAGIIGCGIFAGSYNDNAMLVNYTDTANLDSYNVGIYEYIMGGTDWTALDGEIKEKNISEYTYERQGSKTLLSVAAGHEDGSLTLPIQGYHGYEAKDDEGNRFELSRGKNNNLKIAIPHDYSGRITISVGLPLWRAAGYVSLAAWALLLAYFGVGFMRRRSG